MVRPGTYNNLIITKFVDFGLYLDGGSYGEILMPKRYMPKDCKEGDQLTVFLYFDSEDRIIATSEIPKAIVGEFAAMKVVSVTGGGAFLDWGLSKDLFIPFSEQKFKMNEGETHVVYVLYDAHSDRIIGSTYLEDYLSTETPDFDEGDAVELLIAHQSPLGYTALINNQFLGILYDNEVFVQLFIGQIITGYIKKIREDGKIDLSLQRSGYEKVVDLSDVFIDKLRKANGFLPFTDKSSTEEIYAAFGTSKKTFKKVIGALYKERSIEIKPDGLYLTHKGKSKNIVVD